MSLVQTSDVAVGEIVNDDLESMTLEEFSSLISSEAVRLKAAVHASVQHALRIGELLWAARQRISARQWRPWLAKATPLQPVTAGLYMRLWVHRDQVLDGGYSSITEAQAALAFLPKVTDPSDDKRLSREQAEEIVRLRQEGLSQNEIARVVGVSRSVVPLYYDPERRRRYRAAKRERAERDARARRALAQLEDRQQKRQMARRAGGSLERVYVHFRKMADEIPRALEEATDAELRAAIREAETATIKVEAAINAALAASRRAL